MMPFLNQASTPNLLATQILCPLSIWYSWHWLIITENIVPSLLRGGYYSAVYGTFNRSIVSNSLATCPTGNCTWAPFTTLSLCHQCMDVSSSLTIANESTKADKIWALPGGPSLANTFDTFALGRTFNQTSILHGRNTSPRLARNNATAITFAVLEAAADKSVSALECSISFCVQEIETSITGGVFNETVLQESTESHLELGYSDPARTIRSFDDRLLFDSLTSVNGTEYPPLSLFFGNPTCLGQIFEFEKREELTLTELVRLEDLLIRIHIPFPCFRKRLFSISSSNIYFHPTPSHTPI